VFFILIYSQLAHMPILVMGCCYFMTKNKIAVHCYCVILCACLTSRVRFHSLEFLLIHCSSGVVLFCVVLQGSESQLLVGIIIMIHYPCDICGWVRKYPEKRFSDFAVLAVLLIVHTGASTYPQHYCKAGLTLVNMMLLYRLNIVLFWNSPFWKLSYSSTY